MILLRDYGGTRWLVKEAEILDEQRMKGKLGVRLHFHSFIPETKHHKVE